MAAAPVLRYDELTWPQVADLPRHARLLVPVVPMAADQVRLALPVDESPIVVLPAIPYGSPGLDQPAPFGLAVGVRLFRRVLLAIQRSLRDQGFDRIQFMAPQRVAEAYSDCGLKFVRTGQEAAEQFAWPEDPAGRVVIVSTGHTEQHGFHLPLGTDTMIADAIAAGIQAAVSHEVVVLPSWPYGASTHTRQFPGTMNLGGRLFEDFFLAVAGRLHQAGARMIYCSNAHGGTHSHLVNVVKAAGERWPQAFVATEFLHTTGPELARLRQSDRGGMGHGGELETSLMLHLRPELVQMDRATIETDFIATPNYYMDWIEGGRLIANPPWTDDTRSGIYGDASAGTAEKGKAWLRAAVEQRLESLDEVRTQFLRRKARRDNQWFQG
jgi:creatinine amidohydrolase